MSDDSSRSPQAPASFSPKGAQATWGPLTALLVGTLAFIGAQFLAAFIIGVVVSAFGLKPSWLDSIAGQFYFVALSDLGILLIIWAFLRGRGADFKQLGLGRRPIGGDVTKALLGYAVYFALFLMASALAGMFTHINLDQKQQIGFDYLNTSPEILMALLSLVILPPIVEEIMFRGFLFTGLRKKLTFVWATLITSALFAALHLLEGGGSLLWVAGLDTLFLSFVLCYLREKTGALWASMMVHMLKNTIAFAFLLSHAIS